jgi:hypothetical protein
LPYQRRSRKSCESKKRTGRARTKRTRIKNHSRNTGKRKNTGIKKRNRTKTGTSNAGQGHRNQEAGIRIPEETRHFCRVN